MKRFVAITTILVMLISVSAGGVYAERKAHGEDAHSPSMSVGSGEDPIPDESTTKENSGNPIVEGPESEDDSAALSDEEVTELIKSVVKKAVPKQNDFEIDPTFLRKPLWQKCIEDYRNQTIAGAAALVLLILIIIGAGRRRARRKARRKAERSDAAYRRGAASTPASSSGKGPGSVGAHSAASGSATAGKASNKKKRGKDGYIAKH